MEKKKKASITFVKYMEKFLGNQKVQNYREIAENMLAAFKALGCSMSLKSVS